MVERAWRGMPGETREALRDRLPAGSLRSLLLDVADSRADAVRPAELIHRWRTDRFTRPSDADPRRVAALEAKIWSLIPAGFDGVELSPVAPLGTVSALAPISQRRVVTTTRLTEVISDSTNALAVEAASRRIQSPGSAVHLAGAHRQLRAQDFGAGPAHFRLFALVSSAPDGGSGATEAELLTTHVAVWSSVLEAVLPARATRIELTAGRPVHDERLHDTVLPRFADRPVEVVAAPERTRGMTYYAGLALRISARDGDTELGDGGLTDWTAKLTSNAKERCVISCVATERLLQLGAA